jgi:arylsulfatase A-like enzyme
MSTYKRWTEFLALTALGADEVDLSDLPPHPSSPTLSLPTDLATDNSHTPLEVPQEWMDIYPQDWYIDRLQYAGMCSLWDSTLGNVTAALQARGMWDNTLMIFSSVRLSTVSRGRRG